MGRGRRKSVLEIVVTDLGGQLAAFRFCRSPGGSGRLGLCLGFHLLPLNGKGRLGLSGAPLRVWEAGRVLCQGEEKPEKGRRVVLGQEALCPGSWGPRGRGVLLASENHTPRPSFLPRAGAGRALWCRPLNGSGCTLKSWHRRPLWARAVWVLCRARACLSTGHSGHLALRTAAPTGTVL